MKPDEIANILFSRKKDVFPRGSLVYGTYEEGVSDLDYLVVVDDACNQLLCDYQNGEFQFGIKDSYTLVKNDYTFVTEAQFIASIRNNEIDTLECIFAKDNIYKDLFFLDRWKLRKSVSSICSNAWVKAKKKLVVEKDYNLRIAQKSLWHSMRIHMFGIQIAKEGSIYDFSEANKLWYDIISVGNPTWAKYYLRYKPAFNKLRSELVELCEKPKNNLIFT